jgi:uncharacterized protein YkwD
MSLFHHLFLPHHTNNQRAKILHPSSLSLIIAVFALVQIFMGQVTHSFPQILGYASQIPASEIIRLTNVARENNGLLPVKLDAQLTNAAAQKAADMFARNYWAHVSPNGTQPWFFITESGYVYRYAGENLARDFSDPNSVVQAWLNSPSHRDNLLNSRYQDIGVAVVDGNLQGRDTTLVVQMFGTKLASAPAVDQTSASVVVHAQGISPTPVPFVTLTPTPVQSAGNVPVSGSYLASTNEPPSGKGGISPFEVTKYVSLGLLIVLVLVLLADVVLVRRRKIVRWTSKSFAHLIFIAILLIAALTILRGQIL